MINPIQRSISPVQHIPIIVNRQSVGCLYVDRNHRLHVTSVHVSACNGRLVAPIGPKHKSFGGVNSKSSWFTKHVRAQQLFLVPTVDVDDPDLRRTGISEVEIVG